MVSLPADDGRSRALGELHGRIKRLETDLTVDRARDGQFTGLTAVEWGRFESALVEAWDSYWEAGERLAEAGSAADDDVERLLTAAEADLDVAEAVLARLKRAWRHEVPIIEARARAEKARAAAVVSFAELLLEVFYRDPLTLDVDDIAVLWEQVEETENRSRAARARAARLSIDLAHGEAALETLEAGLRAGRERLEQARLRIAGFPEEEPVTTETLQDLSARFAVLRRSIEEAPIEPADVTDLTIRLADDLAQLLSDLNRSRERWQETLALADRVLARRATLRGRWTGFRAKASALAVDEDPEVSARLRSTRELLWTAPCDLDRTEAELVRLARLLEER